MNAATTDGRSHRPPRRSRWRVSPQAHPRALALAKAGFLFVLFSLLSWRRLDPDFGWHLQTGNYIRAHGLPAHDIFTYTAPHFRWIDHEWGNDVIVSMLYAWGGYGLVALAFGALWAAALLITNTRTRFIVLLAAAAGVAPYAGVRPVAWTALFLAITLKTLESSRRRLVWLLPLLFVLWANVHGGFVIGLAIIVFYLFYQRRLVLLGVAALCGLATLLNAYGPRLYVEVARTLFDPALHQEVVEWMPFLFPTAAMLFVMLWFGIGGVFGRRSFKQWLRPSTLLFLAACSASRNFPLFAVGATRELDDALTHARRMIPSPLNRITRGWLVSMTVLLLSVVAVGAWSSFEPLRFGRDAFMPTAAVTYLKAHGCAGGNLFNDYTYGGYLIWQLPSQPVFIDGRMPSWHRPDGSTYYQQYAAIVLGGNRYIAPFQTYNIRCSLLRETPIDAPLIQTLQRAGWRTAVERPEYVLQVAPKQ